MRSLSDTLERLARLRSWNPDPGANAVRLAKLEGFGSNPGDLLAKLHVPANVLESPPLVVVLHGCTQTAASYDVGAGWSKLADEHGFVVLLPEQTRSNNGNLCFNWFVPDDIRRGRGEAHSIRQMIDTVVSRHGIDPRRIYVTGLSAGGAMANAMLSAYPELFAGGAVIAGLPYGVASTVPEAFDRMRGHGLPSPDMLQSRLRAASPHQGPWPTVSIWHGTQDRTVSETNGHAIVEQWRDVHGASLKPDLQEPIGLHSRTVWKDGSGRDAIEYYQVAGMGHGTPIDPSLGYETAGPYILDVGLSSTLTTARSWGLLREGYRAVHASPADQPSPESPRHEPESIQQIIEKALRSAGLMR
jgi:poly(hydroxyalkanoate) depolymerase family esterase